MDRKLKSECLALVLLFAAFPIISFGATGGSGAGSSTGTGGATGSSGGTTSGDAAAQPAGCGCTSGWDGGIALLGLTAFGLLPRRRSRA